MEYRMRHTVKDIIIGATQYKSGYDKRNNEYVISASMLGKEPLQNYLSIVYGTQHEDEITDATLGTIFHRGMETIVQDKVKKDENTVGVPWMEPELSMNMPLGNGWVLSGTADLVNEVFMNHVEIHDYKLTKSYALKMYNKEKVTHPYTKQMHALELLWNHQNGAKKERVDLLIEYFLKDAKALDFEKTHQTIVVPTLASPDVFVQQIVEQTNSLQAYIEAGEVPPQCADTWPRNSKGVIRHTRCELYCSFGKAGLCPHYSPNTRTTVNRLAKGL